MKEEERLERIRLIEEKKKEMRKLKTLTKEFKELQKDPKIKRYLVLERTLSGSEIMNTDEIVEKTFLRNRYMSNCSHDIWFFMGGFSVQYDYGPESRDSYCYEFDEDKIQIYRYKCLECCETIEIPKNQNEEFLKNHNVMKLNKRYITSNDFLKYNKEYYKLLLTGSTERAYKKLVKRSDQ